jgi:hypothetical protein
MKMKKQFSVLVYFIAYKHIVWMEIVEINVEYKKRYIILQEKILKNEIRRNLQKQQQSMFAFLNRMTYLGVISGVSVFCVKLVLISNLTNPAVWIGFLSKIYANPLYFQYFIDIVSTLNIFTTSEIITLKDMFSRLQILMKDNALFKKVARNLNSLLEHVKSKNPSEFDKIKLLMDPNMVVSWFILVQPTKSTDHHISDDSYNDWELTEFSSITGVETIRSIFESNDKNNEVKDQAKARKDITRVGFKSTQEAVIKAYNNHVKLLEDEIRFRFSDDTTFEKSDINELSHLNWDEPKKSLVIFSNVSDGCLNNPALHSIMTKFIDSNAFKYTLYNAKIHERLTETISGAGNGNSNVKKMISILGNKNRNFIKNMEKTNENKALSKFVSSLTSKQKSSLKELLKNFD